MADLFPIFLKLDGRAALVVGGGAIAEQKLGALLQSGAMVTVVAPVASQAISKLRDRGVIRLRLREFMASDLEGTTVVIAATGNPDVNENVFSQARSLGILCNSVDEPNSCDFYYPSVVKRGDLQIAISTNGKSPALAQRLRIELEQYFDTHYTEWVDWLGRVRDLYFRNRLSRERRVRALHSISSGSVYERFKARALARGVHNG